MLLFLLFAAEAPADGTVADDFKFVSSIIIRNDKLTERELKVANHYASCVSLPYFPLETERQKKLTKCRVKMVRQPTDELGKVLGQINQIIAENSGSEASLSVKRDNAPNQ
jgi:hypothetical protein